MFVTKVQYVIEALCPLLVVRILQKDQKIHFIVFDQRSDLMHAAEMSHLKLVNR